MLEWNTCVSLAQLCGGQFGQRQVTQADPHSIVCHFQTTEQNKWGSHAYTQLRLQRDYLYDDMVLVMMEGICRILSSQLDRVFITLTWKNTTIIVTGLYLPQAIRNSHIFKDITK